MLAKEPFIWQFYKESVPYNQGWLPPKSLILFFDQLSSNSEIVSTSVRSVNTSFIMVHIVQFWKPIGPTYLEIQHIDKTVWTAVFHAIEICMSY